MADHEPNEGSASNPTGGDNFKATTRTFMFDGGNLTREPDVVMRSVLNSIGIGELARTAGMKDIVFQSGPLVTEFPLRVSVPNPSFELPMSQFYIKLSEFMKWMHKQLKKHGPLEYIPPTELHPKTQQYFFVLNQAHELIEKNAVPSFKDFATRLLKVTSPEASISSKMQEEIVLSGHVMQQLGALLLELGRILFNFHREDSILSIMEVKDFEATGSKTRNFFLGTENAEDPGYGLVPNVDEVILSVLNTLKIGGLPGTAGLQGMQFPPPQAPILDSLYTISELFVKLDEVLCNIVPQTEVATAPKLNGEPLLRVIGFVLEQASNLLLLAQFSLIQVFIPLGHSIWPKELKDKKEGESTFQCDRLEYGLPMHHLGAVFLALGRTLSTFCMAQQ